MVVLSANPGLPGPGALKVPVGNKTGAFSMSPEGNRAGSPDGIDGGLLGGGLVCLLVINTTLAAASYRIDNLQQSNATASQQVQQLQQQVASEQSPTSIEQRAVKLGMRPQQVLNFVDLKTGHRSTMPSQAQGAYAVPGYTP